MGFSIIAKTAIQKNPAIGINVRVILQPNVYYTCPAGKVARVVGKVVCTGTGAAAEARFLIDGTIAYRWVVQSAGAMREVAVPDNAALMFTFAGNQSPTWVNTYRFFDFTLNAGEDFSTAQDSGTNAEFNVFAEVLESPA